MLALLGCDVGPRDDERAVVGELHVVGVSVGEDETHFADETIEISFDRLLRPSSVVRQSFVIRDAFGAPIESPLVSYDPVLRVVRIDNPRLDQEDATVRPWMLDNQPYTLTLGVPKPDAGTEAGGGFRALDGAPLSEQSKRRFGFIARVRKLPAPGVASAPTGRFCAHVMPLFQAKCVQCHGPARTDMGLDLSSALGLQTTAIGRLARTTARGSASSLPTSIARGFGRDMAIVDPRSPGTSVLLYKVLMAAPAGEGATTPSCGGESFVPQLPTVPYFAGLDLSARNTLAASLTGQSMPLLLQPKLPAPSATALSLTDQRVLAAWIADGARVSTCAPCDVP